MILCFFFFSFRCSFAFSICSSFFFSHIVFIICYSSRFSLFMLKRIRMFVLYIYFILCTCYPSNGFRKMKKNQRERERKKSVQTSNFPTLDYFVYVVTFIIIHYSFFCVYTFCFSFRSLFFYIIIIINKEKKSIHILKNKNLLSNCTFESKQIYHPSLILFIDLFNYVHNSRYFNKNQ